MKMPQLYEQASALDQIDPLSSFRSKFQLDAETVYLDGNSLGPMIAGVPNRLAVVLREEWANGLIRSWNSAGWIDLANRTAERIAALIGAGTDCVTVADSTSVNLFKVLGAALSARPDRRELVSERSNFPTDIYVAEGMRDFLGRGHELVLANSDEEIMSSITQETAVVLLTHVDFRTGRLLDMKRITEKAHEVGALVIWDLAHSAGALPVYLDACNADFAVGCGYKYLNGGPGAPSFVYVNRKHHGAIQQPLQGWFSHAEPFAFGHSYQPHSAINQYQCGTPPILSLAALEESLKIWEKVSMEDIRKKSLSLTDFFLDCLDHTNLSDHFKSITPKDHERRGSQVSLAFDEDGYAVMQALIANNVIGDFRAPDLLRFGFAPLYNTFTEVARAVDVLREIFERGLWKGQEFARRKAVT